MKYLSLLVLIVAPGIAGAFGIGPTTPSKWGSPVFGSGAHVTYSFMDGIAAAGDTNNIQDCDGGTNCVALSSFMPVGFEVEIERAFDAWGVVANLTFDEIADDGADWNTFTNSGDIRFSGHAFDGNRGVLAHGYFPPVNGLSAAGDVHFDSAESWKIGFGGSGFDIFIVALHEIGHAIGLDHENNEAAIMNSRYSEAFSGLQTDDIAGIQHIYGAAVVPVPAAVWLFASGIMGLAGIRKKKVFSQATRNK